MIKKDFRNLFIIPETVTQIARDSRGLCKL